MSISASINGVTIEGVVNTTASLSGTVTAGSVILNDYVLTVSDITGGHRLTIVKGATTQTMDVLDGEKGDTGAAGRGIASIALNSDYTLTITYTDGTTTTTASIRGEKGDKGDTGDKGDKGDKGDPGTTTWEGITDKPSTFPPSAHTHDDRYYTETEADSLLGEKQDTISDLATIRSGAALGATAIQEHQSLAAYRTSSAQDAIDNTKVDKVSGKGLSTEDYTSAEKTKLAGVEEGAEVNPSAFLKSASVSGNTLTLTKQDDTTVTYEGGAVESVNGKTGAVVLDNSDVGAAAAVHTHDDRYYTESETDTLLDDKQDTITGSTDLTANSLAADQLKDKAGDHLLAELINDEWYLGDSTAPINATDAQAVYVPQVDSSGANDQAATKQYVDEHHDSTKQDVVSDLATIRSGAAAGATAYQKPANGIPDTDIASAATWNGKQNAPIIKTAMDSVAIAGAQYFLGTQTSVSITMPTDASVGQEILVCFTSGSTACTLVCDLSGFSFVPKANTTSWIKFTLYHKADTSVSGDEDEWIVETKEG